MIKKSILLFFVLISFFSLSVGLFKGIQYLNKEHEKQVLIEKKQEEIRLANMKKDIEKANNGGIACPPNFYFNEATASCQETQEKSSGTEIKSVDDKIKSVDSEIKSVDSEIKKIIEEPSFESRGAETQVNSSFNDMANQMTSFISGTFGTVISFIFIIMGFVMFAQTHDPKVLFFSLTIPIVLNFLPTFFGTLQ